MKRVWFRAAFLLAVCLPFAAGFSPRAESREGDKITRPREAPRKLRVLVLDGTPRHRGLVHGRAMKDQIR